MTVARPAQPGSRMLSKIKDLAFAYLQDGLPIVTTVTGALIGVNKTDSIYKVMGYGIAGWTVGYLGQVGFFKLITGPAQRIPEEAGELAPKYSSPAHAAPPIRAVPDIPTAPAVGPNVPAGAAQHSYGDNGFDPTSFGS